MEILRRIINWLRQMTGHLWKPITRAELEELIQEQLDECELEQKATFEKYRVLLRQAPIERYGKLEHVFFVARNNDEVMYYEDVEEGFNFSPINADGKILEHWCNQDELKHALWHWMGHPQKYRLGPAEPLSME